MPHRIFGLIGYPLTHSYSSKYFTHKFETEGIDAEYLNFELPDIGDLMELIAETPALSGLNVTIPYKEQVIPYLDGLDEEAAAAGAVNVISIGHTPDGDVTLTGHNSDVIGFRGSIAPLIPACSDKALILGTGGASKAVASAFRSMGIDYLFVSRSAREGVITYDDLTPEIMAERKIIVNATPVGMYPDIELAPRIPYECITPAHLCFDLIYNPDVTEFMRRAAEHGAKVKNGFEMLLLQAEGAWKIWNQ